MESNKNSKPDAAIRFERGLLVSSNEPANSNDWRLDDRLGRWVAPAILHAKDPVPGFSPCWPASVHWPAAHLAALRGNQKDAVAAWMLHKRGQIVMPPGSGKTEVALELMHRTSVATLVVAPVRALMYQWQQRIKAGLGYETGIIGDGSHDIREVTCTTYHSASNHMERLGDKFELLIFDEEHHLPGFDDAARMSAAPWRLGLTATPQGAEATLDELVGPVCYHQTIGQAQGSILAGYDIVRVPVHLGVDAQREYERLGAILKLYAARRIKEDPAFAFDEHWWQSCPEPQVRKAILARRAMVSRAPEKLDALEDIFLLHPRSQTIVFVGCNAMALDVSKRFLIPPLLSGCGKKERAEILGRFASGNYSTVVANRILDEGVDVPAATVAVILGGTASTRQELQRLGRVLRPCGGKRAVLYEVVCQGTGEVRHSRERRKSDAFKKRSDF